MGDWGNGFRAGSCKGPADDSDNGFDVGSANSSSDGTGKGSTVGAGKDCTDSSRDVSAKTSSDNASQVATGVNIEVEPLVDGIIALSICIKARAPGKKVCVFGYSHRLYREAKLRHTP